LSKGRQGKYQEQRNTERNIGNRKLGTDKGESGVSGGIMNHQETWEEIGCNQKVLKWIKEGYIIRPDYLVPRKLKEVPMNWVQGKEEQEWIQEELQRLISKETLEIVGEGKEGSGGIRQHVI
jgi:hypothetical protein